MITYYITYVNVNTDFRYIVMPKLHKLKAMASDSSHVDYFEILSRQVQQLEQKNRSYKQAIQQAPLTLRDETQRYKYMFNQSTELLELRSTVFETAKKVISYLQHENDGYELQLEQLKSQEEFRMDEVLVGQNSIHSQEMKLKELEIESLKLEVRGLTVELKKFKKTEKEVRSKDKMIRELLLEKKAKSAAAAAAAATATTTATTVTNTPAAAVADVPVTLPVTTDVPVTSATRITTDAPVTNDVLVDTAVPIAIDASVATSSVTKHASVPAEPEISSPSAPSDAPVASILPVAESNNVTASTGLIILANDGNVANVSANANGEAKLRADIHLIQKELSGIASKFGDGRLIQDLINRNETIVQDNVKLNEIIMQQKLELDRLDKKLSNQEAHTYNEVQLIEQSARRAIQEKLLEIQTTYTTPDRVVSSNFNKYKKLLQLRSKNEINNKIRIIKQLETDLSHLGSKYKQLKMMNSQLLEESEENKRLLELKENVIRIDQKLLSAYSRSNGEESNGGT